MNIILVGLALLAVAASAVLFYRQLVLLRATSLTREMALSVADHCAAVINSNAPDEVKSMAESLGTAALDPVLLLAFLRAKRQLESGIQSTENKEFPEELERSLHCVAFMCLMLEVKDGKMARRAFAFAQEMRKKELASHIVVTKGGSRRIAKDVLRVEKDTGSAPQVKSLASEIGAKLRVSTHHDDQCLPA